MQKWLAKERGIFMSSHRQETMFTYFDEKIAACERKKEALAKDERADEAVFERIRANVYDIFKAMLRVGIRQSGGEDEVVKCFFLEKIEQIPASWHDSYSKAEQYGDAEKEQVEIVKLEAVKEIRTAFEQIWEAQS